MRIGIMSASLQGAELHENQRLMHEISERGHDPVLINYRRSAVAVTEAGRELFQYDNDDKLVPVEVEAVIPRIGKYVESGVLVLELLTANEVYSTAQPSSVLAAKNKMMGHIMLDKSGIPTPYSIAPTGVRPENPSETLKRIQPDHKEPVIIKTTRGSHGQGVVLAETRRSAKSQAQAFQANGIRYLIQEFAEAPQAEDSWASDVRLIVVEGIVIASMKRQAGDEYEFRSNLSLHGEGFKYEPTPRETDLAIRAAYVFGLKVAGVDIIPSSRGPLVNEVNVSPEFGIEKVADVNVAGAIAELAINNATVKTGPQVVAPEDAEITVSSASLSNL